MRLNQAKLNLLQERLGQPVSQIKNVLQQSGLFRGANLLASLDTESFRLDELKEVDTENEKLIFSNVSRKGSITGAQPLTYAVPADVSYIPIRGETGIAFASDDETHYPIVVMSANSKQIEVVGNTDGENWELTLKPTEILLPVFALTEAGMVTQSVYSQFFAPRSVDKPCVFEIGVTLANLKLSINDFLDYLLCPHSEIENSKLFKRLARKDINISGNDVFTYLLSGELTPRSSVPNDVHSTEAPIWADMKTSELRKFYSEVCSKKKIPEDDRETQVSRIREHLVAIEVG